MDETQASYIIEAYESLEDEFVEFLKLIPFDIQNKETWSPKLVGNLLDCGSLLDSVFRNSAQNQTVVAGKSIARKKLKMCHFHKIFNYHFGLGDLRTLVFVTPPVTLVPFESWNTATASIPLWWQSYNKIKHDRLAHSNRATTDIILNALCGLFETIARNPILVNALVRHKWLDLNGFNFELLGPILATDESIANRQRHLAEQAYHETFLIQTKLFATTIGPNPIPADLTQLQTLFYQPRTRLMTFLGRGF